jgi:hypothetical protein
MEVMMKLRKIKDRGLRKAFRRIRKSERDGSFIKYIETEEGKKNAVQILWHYHNKAWGIRRIFPVLANEKYRCSFLTEAE